MKRKNRVKLFLGLVVVILSLNFSISFAQCFSNNLSTGVLINKNANAVEDSETNIAFFTFRNNYDTHDWILDSAIRLIYHSTNSDYKKYIEWLYPNEIFIKDYDININGLSASQSSSAFNNLDKYTKRFFYGMRGTLIGDYRGEWVSERRVYIPWSGLLLLHNVRLKYDKKLDDYIFIYDSEAQLANDARNDCLKKLTGKGTEKEYLDASICIGGIAHFIGDLAHLAHSSYDNQWQYANTHGFIDRYASIAGRTRMTPNTYCAQYGLGKYPEISYYEENEPNPSIHGGTYYGPSISGAIEWAGEDRWDANDNYNTYFPNGGPDWLFINPLTLYTSQGKQLGTNLPGGGFEVTELTPMPADYVARKMAKLTFSGWDDLNGADPKQIWSGIDPKGHPECGPYSSYRLPTLNYFCDQNNANYKFNQYPCNSYEESYDRTKERTLVLLKWAVYFTACAILEVCKEAYKQNGNDWPEELTTTPTMVRNQMLPIAEAVKIQNEQYQDHIYLDEGSAYGFKSSKIVSGVMLSACVLSVVIVSVILPELVIKGKELEKEQTITNPE